MHVFSCSWTIEFLATIFLSLGDIKKYVMLIGIKDFESIYGCSLEKPIKCLEDTKMQVVTHFKMILMQSQSIFEAEFSILDGQMMKKCLEYLCQLKFLTYLFKSLPAILPTTLHRKNTISTCNKNPKSSNVFHLTNSKIHNLFLLSP